MRPFAAGDSITQRNARPAVMQAQWNGGQEAAGGPRGGKGAAVLVAEWRPEVVSGGSAATRTGTNAKYRAVRGAPGPMHKGQSKVLPLDGDGASTSTRSETSFTAPLAEQTSW